MHIYRCSCYLFSTTAADNDEKKEDKSEADKKNEEMAAQLKKLEDDVKDTKVGTHKHL